MVKVEIAARLGALAAGALLAGCVAVEQALPPKPQAEPPRSARLHGKPISIAADCAFRDETGYSGNLQLQVSEARVQRFEAVVNVPRHGSCRFSLGQFRQSGHLPTVQLDGASSRCTVRMWQQGRRVTVAFADCQDRCTGDAHDYLWPIMANSTNGTCG